VPVVILTSSKQEQDLVEGYKLGANSYIQKPVDFDQFRFTVKRMGYYWLLVNQPPPSIAFTGSTPDATASRKYSANIWPSARIVFFVIFSSKDADERQITQRVEIAPVNHDQSARIS